MILDKEADANAVIDKGKDVVTRTDMTQILIKKLLGEEVDVEYLLGAPCGMVF